MLSTVRAVGSPLMSAYSNSTGAGFAFLPRPMMMTWTCALSVDWASHANVRCAKTDMPAVRMQRFEQRADGLSLGDRVGGDECERRIRFRQVGGGLPVPSGRVVEISVILASPHGLQIFGLAGGLGDVSDERRVAHHIRAFITGQQKTDEVITIVTRERSRWRRGTFEDAFKRLTSPQRPSLHE